MKERERDREGEGLVRCQGKPYDSECTGGDKVCATLKSLYFLHRLVIKSHFCKSIYYRPHFYLKIPLHATATEHVSITFRNITGWPWRGYRDKYCTCPTHQDWGEGIWASQRAVKDEQRSAQKLRGGRSYSEWGEGGSSEKMLRVKQSPSRVLRTGNNLI